MYLNPDRDKVVQFYLDPDGSGSATLGRTFYLKSKLTLDLGNPLPLKMCTIFGLGIKIYNNVTCKGGQDLNRNIWFGNII